MDLQASRRQFLGAVRSVAAAIGLGAFPRAASAGMTAPAEQLAAPAIGGTDRLGRLVKRFRTPLSAVASAAAPGDRRRQDAFLLRAFAALNQPPTRPHPKRTYSRVSHFSKCLTRVPQPDDAKADWGLADQAAFDRMASIIGRALRGDAAVIPGKTTFDAVETLADDIGRLPGGKHLPSRLHFTNPLSGLSFDLEALDAMAAFIREAPAFSSGITSAEMAELYYIAANRDLSLTLVQGGSTSPEVLGVCAALGRYPYFQRLGGFTPERLFRADLRDEKGDLYGFPGVSRGPYLSQFLLRGTEASGALPGPRKAGPCGTPAIGGTDLIEFGTLRLSLRQKTALAKKDYLNQIDSAPGGLNWFAVQNGDASAIGSDRGSVETALYFVSTLRDGASYVHFDRIYQEYLIAAVILLADLPGLGAQFVSVGSARGEDKSPSGSAVSEQGAIRDEKLNFGNPYYGANAQVGFATFGLTQIVTLVAEVSTRAQKAGWYHKWTQLRLRPEEYGARVHVARVGGNPYHLDTTLLKDPVLDAVAGINPKAGTRSSYLLPMAFSEGSPTHPSYPSGHACVAGACVTVLKAMFNETRPLSAVSVVPDECGIGLRDAGIVLTVGGELNKLANNIAMFRTMAGVHWRSDQVQGLLLGEQVAVQLLLEQSTSFTANGRTVSIASEERPRAGRPSARFTLFSGQAVEIREGAIWRYTRQVVSDDGVYTCRCADPSVCDQSCWGDADQEISWDDLVNIYQRNPAYKEP